MSTPDPAATVASGRWEFDRYGMGRWVEDVSAMMFPVECRWCRRIHDSGPVEVIARYTDCSVWRCPHCGNQVDDRPEGWGGSAFPVDKRTGQRR